MALLRFGVLSVSNAPIQSSDIISTSLHYTDGETDVSISCGSDWAANTSYDVYEFNGSGSPSICTAPRGNFGVHGGEKKNTAAMLGSTAAGVTVPVAAGQAYWLGSIDIGIVAGQLVWHESFGQNRRKDVWNGRNQRLLVHKVGGAPMWQHIVPAGGGLVDRAWGPIDANNNCVVFTGEQTQVEIELDQAVNTLAPGGGSAWGLVGIGFGFVTGTPKGFQGETGLDLGINPPGNGIGPGTSEHADYKTLSVGSVKVTAMAWARAVAAASFAAQVSFFGSIEGNQVMTAKYLG
jgi:hypothetical protein